MEMVLGSKALAFIPLSNLKRLPSLLTLSEKS